MENRRGELLDALWEEEEEEEDGVAASASSSLRLSEAGDVQVEMLEKARELFQLCDKEEKGFITKLDMQRLQSELPLTPEQLEAVFDSLEQDNNGYLTPVEFSMGLGKFIGIELYQGSGSTDHSRHEETFESGWSDDLDQTEDEEEKRFCSMMEQLGAAQVFEDQSEVRELWTRLQKERPDLLANFEEFLFHVSSYIREVHYEKESMEQALKRKETDHDREVRCLYEEMEQQIKAEKERLLCQESLRHDRSNLLQKELRSKEQELEKILYRQKKLEHQIQSLNSEQLETRVQNERLQLLNENLLEQLERSKWELEVAKGHLERLQKEAQCEQEQKDRDVFRVSKNMQKEKQSLLRQLELLREMNKKLRDDRDAFEAKKLLVPGDLPLTFLEDITVEEPNKKNCKYFLATTTALKKGKASRMSFGEGHTSSCEREQQQMTGAGRHPKMAPKGDVNWRQTADELDDDAPLSPREQPIGTETMAPEPVSSSPERLFKVVFVGNSGVGKSSFIHRFCYDRFLAEISATIGIDYQVKSLMVDNTQVALQLWDTAGQERFRSITKQYFRKVDGIFVMYDITDECSFVAVRNWMSSIQEGIEDGAMIFLLGNKMDAAERETQHVPKTEGERLAKEYKAVFYECSAMTGYNILEPMLHMARLLTAQEDKQRESALHLEEYHKRKGCCM
ncbi:EF-hand calcium-binding domain-containing protein 4A [Mauremys mutica]|uniref:EF-hand calcium-binding domain-containing protein 4A n=1 Tax=Mauremys mutica TaxID=74926 RepID=UPI001D16FA9F|nr:EF-hand calcium-binding domain-containing protein 4A [Mauremys mutica]XP_044871208.1 EF-hand calcium-binding domain-containing protein 4A [Mauremys mutica]XP_044871209.1 EF-hand calcium-binding domain-containing protein 4A [Mauremys mutica]